MIVLEDRGTREEPCLSPKSSKINSHQFLFKQIYKYTTLKSSLNSTHTTSPPLPPPPLSSIWSSFFPFLLPSPLLYSKPISFSVSFVIHIWPMVVDSSLIQIPQHSFLNTPHQKTTIFSTNYSSLNLFYHPIILWIP